MGRLSNTSRGPRKVMQTNTDLGTGNCWAAFIVPLSPALVSLDAKEGE